MAAEVKMTERSSTSRGPTESELTEQSRRALMQALRALQGHLKSIVVIGAHAVYLHTGGAGSQVAEFTKDSDLAFDVRHLDDQPLIEVAMREAGFQPDPMKNQPGAWLSPDGIPVDLMVPGALAGGSGSRAAIHPPHDKRALRKAAGLEATLVDYGPMEPSADEGAIVVNVAGPAALLVAKLHKIGERADRAPGRLVDKDAHDVYRLLSTVPLGTLSGCLIMLLADDLAGPTTKMALGWLAELFAAGPDGVGSQMAGRTEEEFGTGPTVAASAAALAADLLATLPSWNATRSSEEEA